MNFNLDLQIAGLLTVLLISVIFFIKTKTKNKGHLIYSIMLINQIVSLFLDMAGVAAGTESFSGALSCQVLVSLLFNLNIMLLLFLFLWYGCYLLSVYRKSLKSSTILRIVKIASICLFVILTVVSVISVKAGLTDIPSKICSLSGICLSFISLVMFIFSRNRIPGKKRYGIYLVILFFFALNIFKYSFDFSFQSFLFAYIVCIIYFILENPDSEKNHQLKKAKKTAEELNQAKTNFLANMSHEIRNPLSVIIGMNDMIMRETDNAQILDYARNVKKSGDTLLAIVNDILDISKIENGKIGINSVDYNFKNFIQDIVQPYEIKASEKNLQLNVSVASNIPSELNGDDLHLKQILSKLLSNAVKYTQKGSITLNVECECIEDTAYLSYSVKDTGIGIKPEDFDKVFKTFSRINDSYTKNIDGAGLGLPITNQLLRMMGSELEIESEFNKGSTFSFKIEQKIVNSKPAGSIEVSKSEESDSNISDEMPKVLDFIAPDAKILAVDDNQMNLYVLKAMLKKTQIQFESVLSGEECLSKIKKTRYDLIFLDHMMPEMDGIQTLSEMKNIALFEKNKTPVVVLTANAIMGFAEVYKNAGFDDYLTKPIDTKKMEDILLKYISPSLIIKN